MGNLSRRGVLSKKVCFFLLKTLGSIVDSGEKGDKFEDELLGKGESMGVPMTGFNVNSSLNSSSVKGFKIDSAADGKGEKHDA